MKNQTVKTSNVVRAINAVKDLHDRGAGEEGMGLLYGRPGEGKTTTVSYIMNTWNAVFLRARVSWTITSMLSTLMEEIGRESSYRRAPMMNDAIEELVVSQRMLIIDEADYLLRQKDMLDAVRDIYDMTGVPILMVMMERAPRKIQSDRRLSRFKRRITRWVEFDGLTKSDTRKVCATLPHLNDPEQTPITIGDDLAMKIHKEADANIGHVVIALSRIERFARTNDIDTVTLADYGDRALFASRGPQ